MVSRRIGLGDETARCGRQSGSGPDFHYTLGKGSAGGASTTTGRFAPRQSFGSRGSAPHRVPVHLALPLPYHFAGPDWGDCRSKPMPGDPSTGLPSGQPDGFPAASFGRDDLSRYHRTGHSNHVTVAAVDGRPSEYPRVGRDHRPMVFPSGGTFALIGCLGALTDYKASRHSSRIFGMCSSSKSAKSSVTLADRT
jgi:hypothetical protein